jgi:hypothetical protein
MMLLILLEIDEFFVEIEERSRREELRGPRVDRRCFSRYKKNLPLPKLIRIPPKINII